MHVCVGKIYLKTLDLSTQSLVFTMGVINTTKKNVKNNWKAISSDLKTMSDFTPYSLPTPLDAAGFGKKECFAI